MRLPSPTTKTEQPLIDSVKQDILSGELPPSSRLRIRTLSQRYGVGGSTVREALAGLVPEGLILFEQNRGFSVAPLSMSELIEITEMRQLVETEAFRRSMEQGDDDWEARIIVAYHRLGKFLSQERRNTPELRLEWELRHRVYHRALIDACPNQKLLQAADQLYDHLARYRPILQLNELSAKRLADAHRPLMDFALARDSRKGVAALRQHFELNTEQVAASLRSDPHLFETLGAAVLDQEANDRY